MQNTEYFILDVTNEVVLDGLNPKGKQQPFYLSIYLAAAYLSIYLSISQQPRYLSIRPTLSISLSLPFENWSKPVDSIKQEKKNFLFRIFLTCSTKESYCNSPLLESYNEN